ncbi:carbohydrate porin [Dokdonella koreensis]|nr:carbohydrate porin [Dokdonella koreensis]
MRFRMGLVAIVMLGIGGLAVADGEPTVEQRLKALEQRVIELERRLDAAPAAPAAPVAAPAPTAPPAAAASRPPAAAPVAPPAPADWQALRKGMTWSQVSAVLGKPGKKRIGVMSEIWFYPDADGGSVEFDRDGRVSGWNAPGR